MCAGGPDCGCAVLEAGATVHQPHHLTDSKHCTAIWVSYTALDWAADMSYSSLDVCLLFCAQVGPIADVPYLKRVAMAHKLHHSNDLGGVPYGLFLGPQEVEAAGGKAILDRMCKESPAQKVSR
jgi:hypothetical protein